MIGNEKAVTNHKSGTEKVGRIDLAVARARRARGCPAGAVA